MEQPTSKALHAVLAILIAILHGASPLRAEVVVLTNQTKEPVKVEARVDNGRPRLLTLPPEDSLPLFAASGLAVRIPSAGVQSTEQTLTPNSLYSFKPNLADGSPTLQQLSIGSSTEEWSPTAIAPLELADSNVITVKVVVDDDEVRQRQAWEPTIRARIDKVSAALEAHCGMKLRIVAIEQWDSDDSQRDFFQTLTEFEREVLPAPADVAIGFSSQYDIASGRVHLGGTRHPLHSHILVKERSRNVLEPERAELLAHELGHYLGATHSADPKSVMRPVIGQGVQRVAGAKLRYDAPNTLLMSMLAEEIRQHHVTEVSAVSAETRRRMQAIYASVAPELPNDPAAAQYVQLMSSAGARPLIEDTAKVLAQIVRVAELKKKLVQEAKDAPPPTGDELLQLYVRQAALAANKVRRENAERAFVLALGIAFDQDDSLRTLPMAHGAIAAIEPEGHRLLRHAAFADMPPPSMHGSPELAQRFFVSGHLVALLGSQPARGANVVRELLDSNGGSGFSFADMAANRGGLVFAVSVLSKQLKLDEASRTFTIDSFLPPIDQLRESLQSPEFVNPHGVGGDQRLEAELGRIEASLTSLTASQRPAAPPAK